MNPVSLVAGLFIGSLATAHKINSWAKDRLKIDRGSNLFEFVVEARQTYEAQEEFRKRITTGEGPMVAAYKATQAGDAEAQQGGSGEPQALFNADAFNSHGGYL